MSKVYFIPITTHYQVYFYHKNMRETEFNVITLSHFLSSNLIETHVMYLFATLTILANKAPLTYRAINSCYVVTESWLLGSLCPNFWSGFSCLSSIFS